MPGQQTDPRPLAVVGNLNVDLWVRTVERFPNWDEELVVESARLQLAGTAGYVMLAAKSLGIPTVVVSTIGDDSFGQYLLQVLHEHGFSTAGIAVCAGEETSLGIVFIGRSGQRAILSTLGAHRLMDIGIVEQHDGEIVHCSELFLCGNYLLPRLTPLDVLPYARKAKERGQLVVFDPSWDPAGWPDATRAATYALLAAVDVYLPTEEELVRLTGRADWHEAVHEVRELAPEIVLKRGRDGAIAVCGAEQVAVPSFPVPAANTIGAGDVFDVGYLFARRQGWSLKHRTEFACALAALVVAQPGDRIYPTAHDVLAFLCDHSHDTFWRTVYAERFA